MKISLLSITPNCEEVIEAAGRTCYKTVDKIKDGSYENFIRTIVKMGHESVVEHAYATFRISGISRACSHQLVRHRLASYSQQSQRYTKEDLFDYVTPPDIFKDFGLKQEFELFMSLIQEKYNYFVSHGIKKEDARFILPNACCTEIVMSANFREWRHFLKLRLDSHAQWEIRELANKILLILKETAPNVFYDF